MKNIFLALVQLLIVTLACSCETDGERNAREFKDCLVIKYDTLKAGTFTTKVYGSVENDCEYPFYVMSIYVLGYEDTGLVKEKIAEEYVPIIDIAMGDKGFFEASLSDPNQEIDLIKVKINTANIDWYEWHQRQGTP